MEFARSVSFIKPYLDHEMNLNVQIMDIMNELRQDKDRDVIEAIEHCEFKLLQQRKKTKEEEKMLLEKDQEKIELEGKFKIREQKVRGIW